MLSDILAFVILKFLIVTLILVKMALFNFFIVFVELFVCTVAVSESKDMRLKNTVLQICFFLFVKCDVNYVHECMGCGCIIILSNFDNASYISNCDSDYPVAAPFATDETTRTSQNWKQEGSSFDLLLKRHRYIERVAKSKATLRWV